MQLTIANTSKKAFFGAPPKAVKAFLSAGKILNDLNISTKYQWFSRNTLFETNQNDLAAFIAARSVFLHRLVILAGHAHEGFVFLQSSPVRHLAKSNIGSALQQFNDHYIALERYFSTENIVRLLRNKVSFHTDASFLYEAFQSMPDDFEFGVLYGSALGHVIFSGIDTLIQKVLVDFAPSAALPIDDLYRSASDQILQIVDIMGSALQDLINYIIHDILKLKTSSMKKIEMQKGPPIDSIKIPFFCAPPEDDEKHRKFLKSILPG